MSDRDASQEVSFLIGSRTLQRNTKEVLDHVQQGGEPVVILRYGRPAAALVPIDEEEAKTLLMAASVQGRRETRAADEPSRTRPLAVSEREFGGEEAVEQLSQTSDRLEAAAESLANGIDRVTELAKLAASGDSPEVDSSLLAIQERNARKLAELVEVQAETLKLLVVEVERHQT